jgi:hypothetical protein
MLLWLARGLGAARFTCPRQPQVELSELSQVR